MWKQYGRGDQELEIILTWLQVFKRSAEMIFEKVQSGDMQTEEAGGSKKLEVSTKPLPSHPISPSLALLSCSVCSFPFLRTLVLFFSLLLILRFIIVVIFSHFNHVVFP